LKKQVYKVVGVMSGTSLDGIDLVCVHFTLGVPWKFSIEASETIAYETDWRYQLGGLHAESDEVVRDVNNRYTAHLGNVIKEFIAKHQLKGIDAVCSHGHTVFHQPERGITFQLGNLKKLAERVQLTVVCDFRTQDVAHGGQGAPLVPIGDQLLFGNYDACLNLGGFANASLTDQGVLVAYDLCAVNTVLNFLAQKKGLEYDFGGALAQKGKRIDSLFETLESLDFYTQTPPKSLGIEWVHTVLFPILNKYDSHPVEDLLYTYSLHIGKQIGLCFGSGQQVLASGGGVKNDFLMHQIQKHTPAKICIPDLEIIDFKEALIFGLLGVLRLREENNCLASVTGAPRDHSSGMIFQP
jgi:anhydro-N-acetylmuramic acid kinase